MKKILTKIFLQFVLITIGIIAETYAVEIANVEEDIISAFGFILIGALILAMVYGTHKIWLTKKTKITTNEKPN